MQVYRILVIDTKRNAVEVDVTAQQLKMIGVKSENVIKHQKRVDLNQTVTNFLNNNLTK